MLIKLKLLKNKDVNCDIVQCDSVLVHIFKINKLQLFKIALKKCGWLCVLSVSILGN